MTPRILYLHGFASSPQSKKARYFAERIPQLEVPDLAQGDFENLTVTGQLEVISELARGEPVHLIGSSLGGYLAALYAARHPEVQKLVLMAPAFEFKSRWPERLGTEAYEQWRDTGKLSVYHYSAQRQTDLDWQFHEDALAYEEYPNVQQPTLIFQGLADTVVPPRYPQEFARRHPETTTLKLVDSDHELMNVLDEIWPAVQSFLSLTPSRAAGS